MVFILREVRNIKQRKYLLKILKRYNLSLLFTYVNKSKAN
jgi:hypothetical protein